MKSNLSGKDIAGKSVLLGRNANEKGLKDWERVRYQPPYLLIATVGKINDDEAKLTKKYISAFSCRPPTYESRT